MTAVRDITEHGQPNKILWNKNGTMKALYKYSPIATYVWQRIREDFVLVDYNDAAKAITQGKIGDLVEVKASEMYQDMPEILEAFSRCFTKKISFEREMPYRFITTGGSRHLAVKCTFIPPDLVLVYTEDITERKRMEEALRVSEERFRFIAERSIEIIFAMDKRGRFTYISPAVKSIAGYTPQEVVGKFFHNYILELDLTKTRQALKALLKSKIVENLPLKIKKKDGTIAMVEINASAILKDGKNVGVQGIVRESTRQKQMEEELLTTKAWEEQFRVTKVFENTSLAIAITDLQGLSIYQNKAFLNLFGYTTDQLNAKGGPSSIYTDPEVALEVFDTSQNDNSWKGELKMVTSSGQTIPIFLRANAIKDENENIIGIINIYNDISRRIKARKEKEKLIKQLAEVEKLVTLGQFTAALTHEINNPLDVIQNKLYLLEKKIFKDNQNPELWDYVYKINTQVSRLSHLAKDILNYVKPPSIVLKPVAVNNILLKTIDSMSDYFTDAVFIETHLKPNLPLVLGDAIGLELVFKNVLLNAIESFLRGGKIFITTRMVNKGMLEINIIDNGKGILEKDLPKIFTPFFTRKRDSGGTGLGLSISKMILEHHNGTIIIKSKPNMGTFVSIHLSTKRG